MKSRSNSRSKSRSNSRSKSTSSDNSWDMMSDIGTALAEMNPFRMEKTNLEKEESYEKRIKKHNKTQKIKNKKELRKILVQEDIVQKMKENKLKNRTKKQAPGNSTMNPLSLTFSKDFINLKETVQKEEEIIRQKRAARNQSQRKGKGNRRNKRKSKRNPKRNPKRKSKR